MPQTIAAIAVPSHAAWWAWENGLKVHRLFMSAFPQSNTPFLSIDVRGKGAAPFGDGLQEIEHKKQEAHQRGEDWKWEWLAKMQAQG
jgi:hypothetical protein